MAVEETAKAAVVAAEPAKVETAVIAAPVVGSEPATSEPAVIAGPTIADEAVKGEAAASAPTEQTAAIEATMVTAPVVVEAAVVTAPTMAEPPTVEAPVMAPASNSEFAKALEPVVAAPVVANETPKVEAAVVVAPVSETVALPGNSPENESIHPAAVSATQVSEATPAMIAAASGVSQQVVSGSASVHDEDYRPRLTLKPGSCKIPLPPAETE
ncbi:MAG TPA: hypothetical protein VGP72_23250 [Planctomycetota bacterium]